MTFGLGLVAKIVSGLQTLTFIASSTSTTGASHTLMSNIDPGDVLVFWNRARNNVGAPVAFTPTGFTNVINASGGNSRAMMSVKVATGSEDGAGVGAMNGGLDNDSICLQFRGDVPVVSINSQSLNSQVTDSAPSNQTITSSGGIAPLISWAGWASTGGITSRGFSPAKDGEVNASTDCYSAYKIYNASPADITVSANDDGSDNCMASAYLECVG